MAGNSSRRGAVRKGKKGATVGSGGVRRRGLEGKGPTPKAQDRPAHKAFTGSSSQSGGARRGGGKGARKAPGSDQVAGRNAVLEALREEVPATQLTVMIRLDTDERVREIMRLAAARGLPVAEASRTDLDRMTDHAVHQGVALTIPPYEYADVQDLLRIAEERFEPPLLIALDGITDPRNLGAILRSADAFGAHGVILPERRSVSMTASVWKVAAGAAGRVRVAQVTNLNRSLTALKAAGVFVLGLDADGDVTTRGLELGTQPAALVVGAEGKGLSRLAREISDQVVSIPMNGPAESLNASVAAAIALYEISGVRESQGLR
ncbi:23S rRNA (guanosine(2251)-2'-O)-methyltransferase RlmB [Brachybacterium saurashtrense]|uniref:23S rRNA (Guanosine(2251)-2'-O)-methyltransferase RlmB n=1 Tax=Brachybacterium saurashtrense TaxID=556288 RepID=A0A345YLK4_9MICO|nr:23S rRNA (guanosine(2251)-2'-O)-methyltransferase RlmB [Brachybacterium saurashtrense]AXK44806.1 23S rRNA (guanosine(2251)-2'-O)-methyltransferase RlmB [Brachybacterium saurashtrense]RRR23418.1 23S rRNA (guanosine(2251)-2'-O)-methyltransferase RlmB [Brachybacterium saurashtrense]